RARRNSRRSEAPADHRRIEELAVASRRLRREPNTVLCRRVVCGGLRSIGGYSIQRMRCGGLALLLAAAAVTAAGQTPEEKPSHPPHAIQDNSFLVEEAYNQEEGIVQHINLFQRNVRTGEWIGTFTQEYPFPGIRHQLSYT